MMPDLFQLYSSRIESFKKDLATLRKEIFLINSGRLIAFLILAISPFKLYPVNHLLGIVVPLLFLIGFLILVKRNSVVIEKKRFLENLICINQNELDGLSHQFSMFADGSEFINPDHINSYDLDLFGKGSLFQFINRTVTLNGKKRLANLFENPFTDRSKITQRQELIAELASDYEWRQHFAATGMLYVDDASETAVFEKWGREKYQLRLEKVVPVVLVILPVISLLTILYWIFYGSAAPFIFSGIVQSIVWSVEKKNIQLIYAQFGKRANRLSQSASLLEKIEKRNWQSSEGTSIVAELRNNGLPSQEVSKLKSIISAFDNRNNILVGLFLNLTCLWDVLCSYRLIRWNERNRTNFQRWDSYISFFDAVSSFSNFAFNHPQYGYPGFSDRPFSIDAEALGHPLIRPEKRVTNDFLMKDPRQLVIVTGANMAGKSTFLRTVGVNMILAMNGAPVCARQMTFTPVEVFSNMRTTDSLFDDESYFFAELKRLKSILEALQKGTPTLIILDEILKGTNSVDKLAGSQKLLRKLIAQKTPAIIATHDLKLTEMESEFPDLIQNSCFEIAIENDEMHFDYTLRAGVTQMMNATFLMRKMGIID